MRSRHRLQGVAGALLTSSSLAVIIATVPERERGPAIGTWTARGTIAGALGPLISGAILSFASWQRRIDRLGLPAQHGLAKQRLIGNFPQAFTHLTLVQAANTLAMPGGSVRARYVRRPSAV